MKRVPTVVPILALIAAASFLSGCGGGNEATTSSPTGSANPATGTTAAPSAPAAALGTEQTAGPFQVSLSTGAPEPQVGETRFEARVTRDGQPVTDATVNLSLSMPSMKMVGPETTLAHTEGGKYEGTANLSMGGEWQAKTTVDAGGETGTAVYEFTAGK